MTILDIHSVSRKMDPTADEPGWIVVDHAKIHYNLIEEIGRGAFGVVYSGVNEKNGNKVALKFYSGVNEKNGNKVAVKLYSDVNQKNGKKVAVKLEHRPKSENPQVVAYNVGLNIVHVETLRL